MEGYTWTPNQWIKEMTCNLAMEKLTFLAKEKIEDFYWIRKPFLQFITDLFVQRIML